MKFGSTPISCGGSWLVFGSTRCGLKRLRGVIASRPCTFSEIARKSRNVRPGEMARTCCSSLRSTASRASMMMLFTPSWSMKLIISFCAPAVMESMATTAPTPKIMPSMVSRLRSLCARRLESPMYSSGKILPDSIALLLSSATAAGRLPMGLPPPFLRSAFLLPFLANGSASATISPGFTPPASTIVDSLRWAIWIGRASNSLPLLHVDDRLAVLLEYGLDRDVDARSESSRR